MPLSIETHQSGEVYILECAGRIAMGDEIRSLEAALDAVSLEFKRLVLHVGRVDRLDSTGIGLLVRYAANLRKRGGDLRLAAAPAFVVKLLNLANLSSYLQVFASEEEAILSFLKRQPAHTAPEKSGLRVLVVDQSPDFCGFVRTVLTQRGFEVKSATHFRDARIALQVEPFDYILVGPDTAMRSTDEVTRSLHALAPRAVALELGGDFKTRDPQESTEVLLRMFGANRELRRE